MSQSRDLIALSHDARHRGLRIAQIISIVFVNQKKIKRAKILRIKKTSRGKGNRIRKNWWKKWIIWFCKLSKRHLENEKINFAHQKKLVRKTDRPILQTGKKTNFI